MSLKSKFNKFNQIRKSLKFKLLSAFIGLNLSLSLILGYTLFTVSNAIYYKSFLLHKKSLGITISNSLDGNEILNFRDKTALNLPEFKRYLQYLRQVALNEEFITWIYTVRFDTISNNLFYAIDASPILEDTIWLENEFLGLKIYINKEGKLTVFWDSKEFSESFQISNKEKIFEIQIDQTNQRIFINNQLILTVVSRFPLIAEIEKGKISEENPLHQIEFTYVLADKSIEKIILNLNYSKKDIIASMPGWEFIETEEIKTKIKNAISTCTFHMPNEPEQVAYGTFIIVIAPIHKSNSECVGAVLFSVSVQDIKMFKSKMAITGVFVTILTFVLTLILSYILAGYFTEPLIKLSDAVEKVSKGNLDINLVNSSGDEFGYLSEKFNEMVQNLKKAYKERESLVALRHELDVAKKIQVSILPKKIPQINNLDISVNYNPMAQVGGDYYDFHVLDKNKIGIFIADVSGHGVPAAIIASMIKIAFSIQFAFADDPPRVLNRINKSMLNNVGQNFVSASYIYLDLENNIMRHARAGHPSIYLHSNDKMEIEEFNIKGKIIGMFPEIGCEVIEKPISKGDRIVMYTDGIIEARNSRDEMFGEELFTGYIRKHIKLKPNDFSKLIMNDVKSWVGNNPTLSKNDDMTLIVVDIK